MPVGDDVSIDSIVAATAGFSGAECVSVVREAALAALSESFEVAVVAQRHLLAAAARVTPQITAEMLKFYGSFRGGRP
jgi:transitional endoplasmic reticulum ATPase